MARHKILAAALAAMSLIGTSAHAEDPVAQGLSTGDDVAGYVGYIVGTSTPALPRSPGEATSDDRAASGSCVFRVDTTDGNNVLLTVRGTGTASGRPRAVATEIQCRVINEAGSIVFDLTRAESGSLAPLAGAVIIRNDGPYTICARAEAKFDDGEDVYWPSVNVSVLACIEP